MPKPIKLKTAASNKSVPNFLASIANPAQRKDAKTIATLLRKVTGKRAILWGDSIVGYGTYRYERKNGDYAEFMAVGFSPRKTALTLYIMPGYQDYSALLKKLGPHKTGKCCLYLKSLTDIDMTILEQLIARGYADLQKTHTVH